MQKFYDPTNRFSSPFDPAMGNIVRYRAPRIGRNLPEEWPAIILRTYPDDRCDLNVFTSMGTRHVVRVPFDANDQSENTWAWLPEKHPRESAPQGVAEGSKSG